MNSIKPFSPRKGLVLTIRNISTLSEDIPDVSAAFRDEEFTYKQESGMTGDILLMLLEAMKQFRASSGGNVSISSNTSVIRNNICTIVNNLRSVADGSGSVNLSLLIKNISEVFSAETPLPKSTDELINRLSQQIEKLGPRSAKRIASVQELRGSGTFSTYAEQSAAKILKKNDNLTAILSYSGGIRVLHDKQPHDNVSVGAKTDDKAVNITVVRNNSQNNIVNSADNGKELLLSQTAPEVLGEKSRKSGDFVINNLYWIPPAEKNEEAGGKDITPKIIMLDNSAADSVSSTLFSGLTQTNTVKSSREKSEQFFGSVKNISVINRTSAIAANFVNKELLHFKAVDFAFDFQNKPENYRKLVNLFGFTDVQQIFRPSNGNATNWGKTFLADRGENSAASVYRELIFRDRTSNESLRPEQAAKRLPKSDGAAYKSAAKEQPDRSAKEFHKPDRDTEKPRTVSAGSITDKAAGAALSELIRYNIYDFMDTNPSQMDSAQSAYKESQSASLESERGAYAVSSGSDKYPESVTYETSDSARNSRNPNGKSRSSLFERIREMVFGRQRNAFDNNEASGHSTAVRSARPAHIERSDKSPPTGKHNAKHTNGENTVKIENSISKSRITSTTDIQGSSEKLTAPEHGKPARIRKFAFNITENSGGVGLFEADTSVFRIYASDFFGSIQAKKNDVTTGEALRNKAAGNEGFNTAEFILLNSYHSESAKTYADIIVNDTNKGFSTSGRGSKAMGNILEWVKPSVVNFASTIENSVSKNHITSTAGVQGLSGKLTAPEYGEPARIPEFAFNITENSGGVGLFEADTSVFRIYVSDFFGSIQAKKNDVTTGEALRSKVAGNKGFNTAEFILLNSYYSESAKTYTDIIVNDTNKGFSTSGRGSKAMGNILEWAKPSVVNFASTIENSVSKNHITSTAGVQVLSGKLTAPEYGESARIPEFAFNITENFGGVGLFEADTSVFRIYASDFFGSIQTKKNDVTTGEALKREAAGNKSFNTAEFILLNGYHSESAKTYAASEHVYAHDAGSPKNPNANSIGKSLRKSSANLLYSRVYKANFISEAKVMSDSLPLRIILSEKAAIKTNRSSSFKKETREFYDRGITYALKFSRELRHITADVKNDGTPTIKSDHSDGKSLTFLFAAGISRQELFGILSAEKNSGQSFNGSHVNNTDKPEFTELILLHNSSGTQSPDAPTTQLIPKRIWLKSSAGIASVSNIIRLSRGGYSIRKGEREKVRSDFSLTEEPRVYRWVEFKNSIIKQSVSDSYETISPSRDVFVRELSHSFFNERDRSFLSGADRSFIENGGWRANTKDLVLKSRRNMSEAEVRLFFMEQNRLMKNDDLKTNALRYLSEAEYGGSESLSFYSAAQRDLNLKTQDAQPKDNSSAEDPELVLAVTKSSSDITQTVDTMRETNEKSDEQTLPKADEIYERLNISESIRKLLSSEEEMRSYIYSRVNSYISEAKNNGEDSAAFISRRNTEIICEQVFMRLEQRLKTERRLNGR